MVRWCHGIDGHEFEQALGDGEGQGSLACCSPWSRKDLDVTEHPNNNDRLASESISTSFMGGLAPHVA